MDNWIRVIRSLVTSQWEGEPENRVIYPKKYTLGMCGAPAGVPGRGRVIGYRKAMREFMHMSVTIVRDMYTCSEQESSKNFKFSIPLYRIE